MVARVNETKHNMICLVPIVRDLLRRVASRRGLCTATLVQGDRDSVFSGDRMSLALEKGQALATQERWLC